MGMEATVLLHAWASTLDAPLACLDDYVISFEDWLLENQHLELTLSNDEKVLEYCYEYLEDIRIVTKRAWDRYEFEEGEDFDSAFSRVTNQAASERLAYCRNIPQRNNAPDIETIHALYHECEARLIPMIRDLFDVYPLTAETLSNLREIFEIVSNRDLLFDDYIGMYFAGFGSDDRFPRGIDLVMYGLIYGRILGHEKGKDESDEHFSSRIVPLAQDSAMRGFLQGYEPNFIDTVKRAIRDAFHFLEPEKLTFNAQDYAATSPEFDLESMIREIGEYVTDAMAQQGRRGYIDEVLGIIEMYSPEELARMSEALVGIQSLRSESRTDTPTVGGEIEVLSVTRYEGHRWVKRRKGF